MTNNIPSLETPSKPESAQKQLNILDKIRIYQLSSEEPRAALVNGVSFGISWFIVFTFLVANRSNIKDLASFAIITLLGALVGAILFTRSMEALIKTQRRMLNARLGLELTGQDRVDLYLWNRQFILPKAHHLQPVLDEYLEYLEDQRNGRQIMSNKTRIFGLILFGLLAIYSGVALIIDPADRLQNGFHVVFFGLLITMYLPVKDGGSKRIYRILSRRQAHNIMIMRKQLRSK
jgi:hypothetical protein